MIATKPTVKEQARPSTDEPRELIDTSKMSSGQRARSDAPTMATDFGASIEAGDLKVVRGPA